MFPLLVWNISGMLWLKLPGCSRGDWDAEEVRDAVPILRSGFGVNLQVICGVQNVGLGVQDMFCSVKNAGHGVQGSKVRT